MAMTNIHAGEYPVVSSEDVESVAVYDHHWNKIGKIDHLLIERQSGRVVSVVVNVSGFFGLGHSHRELSWNSLKYNTRLGGYETDEPTEPR